MRQAFVKKRFVTRRNRFQRQPQLLRERLDGAAMAGVAQRILVQVPPVIPQYFSGEKHNGSPSESEQPSLKEDDKMGQE